MIDAGIAGIGEATGSVEHPDSRHRQRTASHIRQVSNSTSQRSNNGIIMGFLLLRGPRRIRYRPLRCNGLRVGLPLHHGQLRLGPARNRVVPALIGPYAAADQSGQREDVGQQRDHVSEPD